MQKPLKVLAVAALILLIFSCKKTETGPAGPTGPQGATGNANVTAQTYTVSTWTDAGSGYKWSATLNVPTLTETVQSSGTVQVFLSNDSGQHWKALPFTSFGNAPNATMIFETATNSIKIDWFEGFGTSINDPNTALGGTCQFKVIVIPS